MRSTSRFTASALWEAVRAELVFRHENLFTFLHNRVQEAAYALIPESEREAVHLRIGRLLVSRTPPEQMEEKIFEIVNQLNRGRLLIDSLGERERIAKLNLLAGKRAIIFLTGYGDIPMSVRAIKAGAVEFLTKPFDDEYLLDAIRQATVRQSKAGSPQESIPEESWGNHPGTDSAPTARSNQAEIVFSPRLYGSGKSSGALDEIIGQSAALRQIIKQVEMVAPTDATVLILGETGTGKELIARELHRRSRRKDKPLVVVNCACIPKDLYESEFFGHARGAFTSAVKDRIGRFEAAAGGTLFLDEVGEIPLELQSKLLRVLQEKRYERVGEEKTRRADVRIVAATNRDLKKEVKAGRFREDLYYRLNVFPMKVAPLRDRKEDIPLLATRFIELALRELGCARPRLTRASLETLQNYDWPGNIRELRSAIERAVIFARGGALEFDLPVNDSPSDPTPAAVRLRDKADLDYLTDSEIQRLERENLFAVLEKTGWKIKGIDGAAELLGVKPTTLISRIEKMGLKRPSQDN